MSRIDEHGRCYSAKLQDAILKMYGIASPWVSRWVDSYICEDCVSDSWVECFMKTDPKKIDDVAKEFSGPFPRHGEAVINSISEYFKTEYNAEV